MSSVEAKKRFNERQLEAIHHKDGPCVVTASPGSGKTSVLTSRIVTLIQDGISQENILCLTFTNKAAKEMGERIKKALAVKKLNFYIGTFHSFCATLLRKYGSFIGYSNTFSIMDDKDQETLIKKLIQKKNLKKDQINVYKIIFCVNSFRENLKTDKELLEMVNNDTIYYDLCKDYLKLCYDNNCIDFSGLLYETVRLFDTSKDLLEKLQDKLKYISVDEMQDTNYIQMHIINMLGEKYKNIFLVGDINQSIYKFRGARYKNILDFVNDNKNCKNVFLEKNYRSTPEIVEIANKLISRNSNSLNKKIKTDNPSGSVVRLNKYESPREEADNISKEIEYLVHQEGWSYSDIAILYRINSSSLDLQLSFSRNQIPFTVIAGKSFFDKMEIRDCLAMLRFLVNPNDFLSFSRIAKLFSGVGDATILKIEEIANDNKTSVLDICKNIDSYTRKNGLKNIAKKMTESFSFDYSKMNAGDCLSYITNKMEYIDNLEKYCPKDHKDREQNIKEFINNATIFGQQSKSIEKYLQNISLASSSDKDTNGNSVVIGTYHSSKGLEWPIVFVPSVSDSNCPCQMCLSECNGDKDLEKEAIEEETRCLYVAISRAMSLLHISFSKTKQIRDNKGFMRTIPQKPSRFLYDCGLLKKPI